MFSAKITSKYHFCTILFIECFKDYLKRQAFTAYPNIQARPLCGLANAMLAALQHMSWACGIAHMHHHGFLIECRCRLLMSVASHTMHLAPACCRICRHSEQDLAMTSMAARALSARAMFIKVFFGCALVRFAT